MASKGRLSIEPLVEAINSCNLCGVSAYEHDGQRAVQPVADFPKWRVLRVGRGNMDALTVLCPRCLIRLADETSHAVGMLAR